MRNFIFSIGTAFFIALIICCSCNGKSSSTKSDTDGLLFDSIKLDSTLSLTEAAAGPKCHVSLNIIYAMGKNADYINDSIIRSGILSPDYFSITSQKITIPQAADSFMTRYLSEYKKDYEELYKSDKEHGASYNCEYIVNTDVIRSSDKYFTYIAHVYNYGGGAHGNSITITKNINVSTGKTVTLKDIFVPGHEHELNELIIKNLCKKYDAQDLNELNDKTIFWGIDVYASDNFIIGNKNITFIYSPDEIACHAEGEIRVEISNSDLEKLFKKQ